MNHFNVKRLLFGFYVARIFDAKKHLHATGLLYIKNGLALTISSIRDLN